MVELEDYINGVLLNLMHKTDSSETMGKFGRMLLLWNPSIREFVKVPPPTVVSEFTSNFHVKTCFGFDPFEG